LEKEAREGGRAVADPYPAPPWECIHAELVNEWRGLDVDE